MLYSTIRTQESLSGLAWTHERPLSHLQRLGNCQGETEYTTIQCTAPVCSLPQANMAHALLMYIRRSQHSIQLPAAAAKHGKAGPKQHQQHP